MKIFVIGKENFMKWPEQIADAFSENHETKLFLYNKLTLGYILIKLILGKRKLFKFLAYKMKKKIEAFNPDLILFIAPFHANKLLCLELKKIKNIKKAAWIGDFYNDLEKEKADCFDVLFITDTGFKKDCNIEQVYLPLCGDDKKFKNFNVKKDLPPFFVGIANKKREEYLQNCTVPCLVYGKNWNKNKLLHHEVINKIINHDKVVRYINRSILPLNLAFSKNNVNGLNFRPFEISLCGGLILTDNASDLRLCYEIGTEALVYNDEKEFNAIVNDIVESPEKYEKIAMAGYKRTLKDHTFKVRANQIIQYCFHDVN